MSIFHVSYTYTLRDKYGTNEEIVGYLVHECEISCVDDLEKMYKEMSISIKKANLLHDDTQIIFLSVNKVL